MIKALSCIAVLSVALMAQTRAEADFLNSAYFFGLAADYSLRQGTVDLGSGVTEGINRSDLVTYGIEGGKRFILNPWLRLQVEGVIKYGTANGDTLLAGEHLPVDALIQQSFFNGAILGDLQIPIGNSGEMSQSHLYLHGGAGLHFTRISETEVELGDPAQTITGDQYPEPPHVMLSPSVHAGIGWETHFSRDFGFALSYSLRYWDPVHYTTTRDEFPLGSPYSEQFFTHELDVTFLIR
jgi:hypothetical protein